MLAVAVSPYLGLGVSPYLGLGVSPYLGLGSGLGNCNSLTRTRLLGRQERGEERAREAGQG